MWEKEVGKKMTDQLKNEGRLNFNQWVNKGGKLSYNQLSKLNSVWKKDYAGKIIAESYNMRLYIHKVGDDLQET